MTLTQDDLRLAIQVLGGPAAAGAPSASASAAASAMADFIIVISLFHGAAGGEDNRPRAPLSRRNRRSRNTAFAIPSDSARLTRCANFQ